MAESNHYVQSIGLRTGRARSQQGSGCRVQSRASHTSAGLQSCVAVCVWLWISLMLAPAGWRLLSSAPRARERLLPAAAASCQLAGSMGHGMMAAAAT
jgi:hypothetical protein